MKSKKKLTNVDLRQLKGKRKITSVTAYDYYMAKMVQEAEIDFILVGDSLGMVVQGHGDTLKVSLDHMVYHSQCVTKAATQTMVVTDMPWLSFHINIEDTIRNASRLIREGGAQAVKIEGGVNRVEHIRACVNTEIPVMGHVGLTPQSVYRFGGFKVQKQKNKILEDALAVQEAGAFAIVLESVPPSIAEEVTSALTVPTIGIGAGANCDGQILVWHDLLGLNNDHVPLFVKKYADIYQNGLEALKQYKSDVEKSEFPADEHTFSDLKAKKST